MNKLKELLFLPFSWILYLFYIKSPERQKLLMDLLHFRKVHYGIVNTNVGFREVYREFIAFAEFRSVFILGWESIQN